jgi:peptide/nickel transport system permease protein
VVADRVAIALDHLAGHRRRGDDAGQAYVIKRLWQMVPTLFGVVLLVFLLFQFFGGDPSVILGGQNATPEQIAAIRQQLGLDQPAWVQLWHLPQADRHLRLGPQLGHERGGEQPVRHPLPATLTVMLPILLLDTLLAVPIALGVAYVRGSLTDRTLMVVTTVALSISFLVYVIVGQYVFGFQLGWFPVQGWSDSLDQNLLHVYAPLPVLLAVMVGVAPQTRLYRSFFLDELGHDYVRTARAKGLTEPVVLFKHVLRNAMIPILTNVGLALPGIFVGSFLIEVFFSIPGLGREVLLAVNRSDYPVIQAVTVYLAMLTMLINLGTDLLYKVVDPRVVLNGPPPMSAPPSRGAPGGPAKPPRLPPQRPRRSEGVWHAPPGAASRATGWP